MPVNCEECGEEKGYDDVINLTCELGFGHVICKDCMKIIRMKAKIGDEEC